jgi:hypothetical protein
MILHIPSFRVKQHLKSLLEDVNVDLRMQSPTLIDMTPIYNDSGEHVGSYGERCTL